MEDPNPDYFQRMPIQTTTASSLLLCTMAMSRYWVFWSGSLTWQCSHQWNHFLCSRPEFWSQLKSEFGSQLKSETPNRTVRSILFRQWETSLGLHCAPPAPVTWDHFMPGSWTFLQKGGNLAENDKNSLLSLEMKDAPCKWPLVSMFVLLPLTHLFLSWRNFLIKLCMWIRPKAGLRVDFAGHSWIFQAQNARGCT